MHHTGNAENSLGVGRIKLACSSYCRRIRAARQTHDMLALSAVLTAGLIGYKSVLSIHGDTLRVPKYGDCDDEFATYVKEFARSSEDSVFRREIFCKNLEFIERHNRLNVIKDGYFLKVGPHADRLPHEVATGGLNFTDFVRTDTRAAELGSRSMESSVDWRSRMPPIKNQQ